MHVHRFVFRACILAACLGTCVLPALAQSHEQWSSAKILHELKRLNTTAKVLYLAAHPDDENTRMISWLNHHMHVETAYLSITRGDGGQNLIGPELREGLGVIRSHELIAARKTDGGRQFFTAANDFGFSKSVEETLRFWDEQKVLSDMVWVIRQFRPDVIITRFSPETGPRATHGHHTASAQLAIKAAQMASDPSSFPEQLKYTSVWKVTRVMWNTSWWFYGDQQVFDSMMNKGDVIRVDVGGFDPLLGESYSEIAARSRSQHRSQGFGSSGTRGETFEYLQWLHGEKPSGNLFSGIAMNWNAKSDGTPLGKSLDRIMNTFDVQAPWNSVPALLEFRNLLSRLPGSGLKSDKLAQLDRILLQCTGLYGLAGVEMPTYTPGSSMDIRVELINRSANIELNVLNLSIHQQAQSPDSFPLLLGPGKKTNLTLKHRISEQERPSQPYWLREPYTEGMYQVSDWSLTGTEFNRPPLTVRADLEIGKQLISLQLPVYYHHTDPAKGERIEPLHIVPELAVSLDQQAYVFQTGKSRKVVLNIQSYTDSVSGYAELNLPQGWKSQPAFHALELRKKGAVAQFVFEVFPPATFGQSDVKAMVKANGKVYSLGIQELKFDHIPYTLMFPEARAKLVHLDLKIKGQKVAFLPGAGDAADIALREMGYEVEVIQASQLSKSFLASFDALVMGIRAFNTLESLPAQMPELLEYIHEGGNLIVQYNTTADLPKEALGPYPFKVSRDRVTDETAEVRFLVPQHPALNSPNKITSADFDHWVQERGLYFTSSLDSAYTALLEMADPDEKPSKGSLIVAPYGKGYYVYTGLSLFRQLPAGVPGAYRLLANLIAL